MCVGMVQLISWKPLLVLWGLPQEPSRGPSWPVCILLARFGLAVFFDLEGHSLYAPGPLYRLLTRYIPALSGPLPGLLFCGFWFLTS